MTYAVLLVMSATAVVLAVLAAWMHAAMHPRRSGACVHLSALDRLDGLHCPCDG